MSNSRKRSGSQRKQSSGSAASQSVATVAPTESGAGDGEITIFLSYARADDRIYKMVSPFKELLGHFIYAKSGRKVRTFFDQEDIGWGEIWRDRLETEILGASVFIPLLSASYLDSENCRMEFNTFQASASALGVNELLLPVLLIDAPAIFNQNSTDAIVRESVVRQWEVIEDAILSDPGSSAWKLTMARLADRFVRSYEAAEAKLAALSESDLTRPPGRDDEDDEDDDTPALAELSESIQDNLTVLTQSANDLHPAIQALSNAASSTPLPQQGVTPQQLQQWSRRAAKRFEEPADQLSEAGDNMFTTTKSLDVDMKRLRRLAIELLPTKSDVAVGYNSMLAQLSGIGLVVEQLNGLLAEMKPAEAISVPLRKALRPASRGLTRVTDSLHLIESWQPIKIPS